MMEFIVGLLVAIPLALFFFGAINRCTNISAQAENNFEAFFNEIEDLAKNGKDGEPRTFTLIMDQKTMVMNFWPSYVDEGFYRCFKDLEEQWSGPGEECQGQDCFCLIQKYNFGEIKNEAGKLCTIEKKTTSVGQFTEKTTSEIVPVSSVRQITPTKIKCFKPEGFYIYQIPPSPQILGWPRFDADAPRRIPVGLVKDKKEDRIYICQNPPCQIPANPIEHS